MENGQAVDCGGQCDSFCTLLYIVSLCSPDNPSVYIFECRSRNSSDSIDFPGPELTALEIEISCGKRTTVDF